MLTVSIVSPSICHELMGPDAMILVFWMLSFKPTFSLSSFTFIKSLFSSSSLSAIRVESSAYLRLLIFLPETVRDFILGGFKITADGDCSHEIKSHLPCRRKATTNVNSILKSRDITLSTKVHLVKAMVFPVVMYGCESWTIKKAECQRIDAFELWCWRRLLRVPWTARRSSQSILKEISPEYSLEGLMLKLGLQYLAHLMQITDSVDKPLMLGKIEGRKRRGDRGWDGWMASPIQWIWTWANSRRWWGMEKPGVFQSMGSPRVGHNLVTEQQQNHEFSKKYIHILFHVNCRPTSP